MVLFTLCRFPHGTEVTFNCIANTMGEKTTWRIHCEDGAWIGQRSPSPCPAVEEEKEDTTEMEKEEEEDLDLGNTSCMWRNNQPNLVTFLEDRELLEEELELPPGTELVRPGSCFYSSLFFSLIDLYVCIERLNVCGSF